MAHVDPMFFSTWRIYCTAMTIHRIALPNHYTSTSLYLTVLECYHVAPVRHCSHKPPEKFRWRPSLRACYLLRAYLLLVSRIFPCRLARFELALLFPVRARRSDTPRIATTSAEETAAAPTASGSRDGALHGCTPRHVGR